MRFMKVENILLDLDKIESISVYLMDIPGTLLPTLRVGSKVNMISGDYFYSDLTQSDWEALLCPEQE